MGGFVGGRAGAWRRCYVVVSFLKVRPRMIRGLLQVEEIENLSKTLIGRMVLFSQ